MRGGGGEEKLWKYSEMLSSLIHLNCNHILGHPEFSNLSHLSYTSYSNCVVEI
jgi:hypothetical protein